MVVDGIDCQTISDEDRKKMDSKMYVLHFQKITNYKRITKKYVKLQTESLDIPYGGYNETTNKVGYILTHTVGKDGIWFIFHANPKCSHLPVEITFAIEKPHDKKDKTIEKRKALKKSLYDAIDQKAVEDADLYDLDVSYTREKIKKKKIICNGFLNSYVDETEGTNKSYVLVDENGKLVRPKHD